MDARDFVKTVRAQTDLPLSALGIPTESPTFSTSNIAYSASVDPSSSNGYSDQFNERAGAYWPFIPTTNGSGGDDAGVTTSYPAYKPTNPKSAPRNQPPAAVPFDEQSLIYVVSGVAASSDVPAGGNQNDRAIRLIGDDKSCVKIEGLSTEDTCIMDPSKCHMKANGARGFSISFWVNLPSSFDTRSRYIFDTGATETGNPGVAISYVSSQTGADFGIRATVLVSTGSQYWRVVMNGMIKSNTWTNVGIRWSPDFETANLAYGLQVFVDKVSTGWTRSPSPAAANTTSTVPTESFGINRWTVGCQLDGTGAMIGRVDELAVWYWRVRDMAVSKKGLPASASEYGEIELFDGDLQLKQLAVPCSDIACLPGSASSAPASYLTKNAKPAGEQELKDDMDTSPAVEGDCRQVDPSTWKGDSMIYCVDTVKELKEAMTSGDSYKALAFLRAVVRIVDKAPNGLNQQDVDDLYEAVAKDGLVRLRSEIQPMSLNVRNVSSYMDIIYVISRLSELNKYNEIWRTEEIANRAPGITGWNRLCHEWLTTIGLGAIANSTAMIKQFRSGNHSAASIVKLISQQQAQQITFPNYEVGDEASTDEAFWYLRNASWGAITDWLSVPLTRFSAYQKFATLTLVMKIHDLVDYSVPAFLDDSLIGVEGSSFFVNSRLLSVTEHGNLSDATVLQSNPVSFTVQHRRQQDDRPFMKGAIVCVRWKYLSDPDSGIGAWDPTGCDLVTTDDRQSTCECEGNGEYAILMEDYTPADAMSSSYYDITLVLYLVSIICLIIFIAMVCLRKGLHYEMHFVHSNLAFAMLIALVFYVSTTKAKEDPRACMIVSAFVQYAYTSAYAWFALAAHYACRAVVNGQLGRILFQYTLIGWGMPGIMVTICVSTRVDLYGFGSRCLGSQSQNFLGIYIGSFLFLCALVLPMLVVSICNLRGKRWANRNPDDWSDVKAALLGVSILWPLISVVWVMAVCIYLIPQPYQAFDFLFEVFNSIQGIIILLCLGFIVPSFRQAFFCTRKYEKDLLLAEEYRRRHNEMHPYYN